jgi:competence protein ComEC
MSFMAVMGLIAVNEWRARWRAAQDGPARSSPFANPLAQTAWTLARAMVVGLGAIALTSLVASVFSGLPAAFHFNRVSLAGVAANLLALPVVSLVVMPAAVVAMLALPLGVEAWPLAVMGLGIEVVVVIAGAIAALPGAAAAVATPPPLAMALAVTGLVALCIGGVRSRLVGAGLLVLAIPVTAAGTDRPVILVEAEGRTIAVRNSEGELVPVPGRRGRFVIAQWLLADGDATPPAEAARRSGWTCDEGVCTASPGGRQVLYIGRGARPPAGCGEAAVVVAADPLFGKCRAAGQVIDRFDLWRQGAHAVFEAGDGSLAVVTSAGRRGERPWTVKPVPRASIRIGGRTP